MRKKVLILVIIAIIVVVSLFLIFNREKKQNFNVDDYFTFLGNYDEQLIENENYVFKDYDDFKEKLDLDTLSPSDFDSNNYVLLYLFYDECSESDMTISDYKISGNNIDILVNYKASCGLCRASYLYYLLKVDKNIEKVNLNIEYESINKTNCDPTVAYKPIIYLYPEKETLVNVKFLNEENLTLTYPKYNNGWEVSARPDGTLKDVNGRTYYGLYWEGVNHYNSVLDYGFVVSKEDLIPFLEEKLEILGLNEKEANEFIIYWLPILSKSEYNYIRFETDDEINSYMPLVVNPKPDTIIRILMDYKPLDSKIEVKGQELTSKKRNGFTLVEWGGSLIN